MENDKLLPLIALKNIVLFPNNTVSFEVFGKKDTEAVKRVYDKGGHAFVSAKKQEDKDDTKVFKTGTVSVIKRIFPLSDNKIQVVAQGEYTAFAYEEEDNNGFIEVKTYEIENEITVNPEKAEGLILAVKSAFETYIAAGAKVTPESINIIMALSDPVIASDMICQNLQADFLKKQELLEESDFERKLEKLTELLLDRAKAFTVQNDILKKTKEKVDKSQKDYYLKEQVKVISEELGEASPITSEIEEFEIRAEKANLPLEAKEKIAKELKRLRRATGYSQESVIIRDYIDCVLNLPWHEKTNENTDLFLAESILNNDHYGLLKVKERIMEFLCVRQAAKSQVAPVLCLAGPPGVGKTSIAKSIAKALNRKYARMSLGGVRDEAEIRGHRRTYVGSMPGRLIAIMGNVKTTNPVILLDEIDKLSGDYKGDPAAALLEVLDSEQNNSFKDHYLELGYDLSDVLFICTANNVADIPPALKDRLEIIPISSYTQNEKVHIAKDFLISRQKENNGIKNLEITDTAINAVIKGYTREAGVRELERLIGTICRKALRETMMAEDEDVLTKNQISIFDDHTPAPAAPIEMPKITVSEKNLQKYLGVPRYKEKLSEKENPAGIAIGLAWTSVGGAALLIEVNCMEGKGKLQLTGNLGEVMKESALAAISFIRANAKSLDIDADFYKNKDIHIHIPEGAVPKDGPSAGITLCTAIISALTEKKVNPAIAMTGELTISGRVLPIGGLKEKIAGGKSYGIEKIIIPMDNEPELYEIEDEIKQGIEFLPVSNMNEIVRELFI